MNPPDLGATPRWPDVPAVYGWLSLDRRGRWRLRGDPVTHCGALAFFNRQYGCDEGGAWFVQNGPQRVFAALDYTPWIVRLSGAGSDALLAHTGEAIVCVEEAWIDEAGNLLLATERGVALLDDRDLPAMLERLCDAAGAEPSETALLALLDPSTPRHAPEEHSNSLFLAWNGTRLPLAGIRRADVPARFGFVAQPGPLTE
ncbi:MAG: hypothetical protein BGO63_05385 [Candidatus Accumulibacter sp. 66-26]|nr:DUF2946 family protein [Accumulibacter sp.]OJW50450.1 MAG: hypothetical protein BGO63_05385 [Candidatus Accumulibacter sp. 66-26]